MSADVKGYSRLMEVNEEETIYTLASYKKVITEFIQVHHGRVVGTSGDSVLGEFSSVVGTVRCAVQIQKELKTRNSDLPENKRMEFRIGINLGDVVEEGEQLYGDGVNIATRVQSLADGGGICISGTAYDQVENKLELSFEYLGQQTVKNITKPVRVYRILMKPEAAIRGGGKIKAKAKQWHRAVVGLVPVLIVLTIAIGIWKLYVPPASQTETISKKEMASWFPDRPSIAVLPFNNFSGNPAQDYLAEGFTENIITTLSKISQMLVIARNSVFTYKGKPVKVQQVNKELGVRYVMEGSVQKAGERGRITAQLVDALKGHHLWAKCYDREMKDLFKTQDEITRDIAISLQAELISGEQARVWHKGTTNLEAWGYLVKGMDLFAHINKDDNANARSLFERAIKIDPGDAFAWTMLAWTHWIDTGFVQSDSRAKSFKLSVEFAEKAAVLDPTLSDVHTLLGAIHLIQRQYEKAISEGRKAIELGPNSGTSHVFFGYIMIYAGKFGDAIAHITKGVRLTPYHPAYYLYYLGQAYAMAGRYEEALSAYTAVLERSKKGEFNLSFAHIGLAEVYIALGREGQAKAHAKNVLAIDPNFSLEVWKQSQYYRDQAHLDRHLDALRKAGLK